MRNLPTLGATLAAGLLATGMALGATMMTVQKDVAVAQQPNANAKTVTTLNAGTQVSVIDTNGQWTHIQAGSVDGYVPTASLK